MKLPELKSKFKNRYAIRIIAGVLVVTLVSVNLGLVLEKIIIANFF